MKKGLVLLSICLNVFLLFSTVFLYNQGKKLKEANTSLYNAYGDSEMLNMKLLSIVNKLIVKVDSLNYENALYVVTNKIQSGQLVKQIDVIKQLLEKIKEMQMVIKLYENDEAFYKFQIETLNTELTNAKIPFGTYIVPSVLYEPVDSNFGI